MICKECRDKGIYPLCSRCGQQEKELHRIRSRPLVNIEVSYLCSSCFKEYTIMQHGHTNRLLNWVDSKKEEHKLGEIRVLHLLHQKYPKEVKGEGCYDIIPAIEKGEGDGK